MQKYSLEILWIPPTDSSNFSTRSLPPQCHLKHLSDLSVRYKKFSLSLSGFSKITTFTFCEIKSFHCSGLSAPLLALGRQVSGGREPVDATPVLDYFELFDNLICQHSDWITFTFVDWLISSEQDRVDEDWKQSIKRIRGCSGREKRLIKDIMTSDDIPHKNENRW